MNLKEDKLKRKNRRHYFFLNPYKDAAFTKCPKCESKTLLRKFPLVIHIKPRQVLILNKKCRYCARCDLIIARKPEVESFMAAICEERNPEIIGNDYLIMGSLEKRDWRARDSFADDVEIIERMYIFKGMWDFEPARPGWYPAKK